jgi:tetratricopeptide (TPR) repeat protein
MSPRPLVFVSAVSKELGSARQLVANTLMFLGYEPTWQDVFGTESGDLREMLRERIDECKGVVQMIGRCYGAEPPISDEEFGRVSYTQYEAMYARKQGKKVWYLFIDENFPADACESEPEQLRQLQAAYRQRVQADAHLFHPLASREALEMSVLKLRDDLTRLRRGVKQWAAGVAILLILSVGLGFWLLRGQRKTAQEIGEAKRSLVAMNVEMTKLRQGIMEYPRIEAKAREPRSTEDAQATQERVYAELGKQLNVDPKLLREKLRQLAEQLKRIPEVPPFERANAAFVAKDYKEAEQLASSIADQIRDDPTRRDEAIRALQLASWSAQARFQYADALRHLRAAENLTDRQARPEEWARIQDAIARILFEQAHYAEAERLWRSVIDVRTQTLGLEHADTLRSRMGLAVAMDAQGKYDAAANENREIVMVEERLAGPEDRDTLASRNNLAETLRKQRKYVEAESEYNEIIKLEEKVFGPEHTVTLKSRNNLAIVHSAEGKFGEAEKEYRNIIQLKEKVLGAEDPETLISRNNLANALFLQRKFAEAESEYRQVVQIEEKVLGSEHPNTVTSRTNLALTLASRGAYAEAEKEYREVISVEEKLLGIEHPDTLRSYFSLAISLARQGKNDEAKQLAARVAEGGRKIWGKSHAITRAAEKLQSDLQGRE